MGTNPLVRDLLKILDVLFCLARQIKVIHKFANGCYP